MKILLNLFIIFFSVSLFASDAYEEATIEEKRKELAVLKAEFEEYYKTQEENLRKKVNTIEIKEILIKKKEKNIQKLLDSDKNILKEIKMEIVSKNIKIYNTMKVKNIAKVFTQMISEHKIQKVYEILIKLKSTQAVSILEKMDPKNQSLLTQLMLNGKKPINTNKKQNKE